jgi:hypothetical protein
MPIGSKELSGREKNWTSSKPPNDYSIKFLKGMGYQFGCYPLRVKIVKQ